MGLAAVGFIGYGVIFFIRNFTDSFLELGIGPAEVDVDRQQIQAFSPSFCTTSALRSPSTAPRCSCVPA
jgi:hypothetical protein